jgi:succinyl-diaminopimelate desuccinylase
MALATSGETLYQRACARVEEREADLINTIRAIVAIDNGAPPGANCDKLADVLEPMFQRLGFQTERILVPEERLQDIPYRLEGPRVNLIARRRQGKEPITIYAHMDTWPVGPGWHFDPLAGQVSEGRMYANGISDVKGNIGCLLMALDVMNELQIDPHFDFICCIGTDKEIIYYPSLDYLTEEGYVEGHLLQLASMVEPIENVGYLGMLTMEVTTRGENDSNAPIQVNALESMVPIIEELMALKKVVERRAQELVSSAAVIVPYGRAEIRIDGIHADYPPVLVPAHCRLMVHRFYMPEESEEEVRAELRATVERGRTRSGALDVQIRFLFNTPPVRANEISPHRRRMRRAYAAARGLQEVQLTRRFGGAPSDIAVAALYLHGDWVHVGAGRLGSYEPPYECMAHHADERVRLEDIKVVTKQLIYYLGEVGAE